MRYIIISTHYPYHGGIVDFVEALRKSLIGMGNEVEVVTFKRQYFGRYEKPGSADIGNRWIDTLNPWTWLRTAAEVATYEPDVVIFKYWHPYFALCFGTISRLLKGCQRLVIIDNVHPHEWFPFSAVLTKWFFRGADKFICMSKKTEADLLALGIL